MVGDFVGETMFFGEGAGAGAAASAVMGDVLEVARHIQQGVAPIVGCTCTDDLPILPMDELVMRYYLRFSVTDRPGVLETMAGVFARHNISVKSIVQRGRSGAERVDQVVVTHRCRHPRGSGRGPGPGQRGAGHAFRHPRGGISDRYHFRLRWDAGGFHGSVA